MLIIKKALTLVLPCLDLFPTDHLCLLFQLEKTFHFSLHVCPSEEDLGGQVCRTKTIYFVIELIGQISTLISSENIRS
jgi:hypothetical protein